MKRQDEIEDIANVIAGLIAVSLLFVVCLASVWLVVLIFRALLKYLGS
jgi:hypothetical protein